VRSVTSDVGSFTPASPAAASATPPAVRGFSTLLPLATTLMLAGAASVMRRILFPLFATSDLHMGLSALGVFYAVSGTASVVVSVAVGRLSDRLSQRRRLVLLLSLWIALGNVLCALTHRVSILYAIEVLFSSFVSVPLTQLFADGAEHIRASGHPRPSTLLGVLRATFSLGFAVGPALAAAVTTLAGLRAGMIWIAAAWLAIAGLMLAIPRVERREPGPAGGDGPWDARVVLFFVAFLLMSLVDAIRAGYLSVFARQSLGLPIDRVAVLFGVTSIFNLALMPLAGALADRWGARRVVLLGALAGALGAGGTIIATNFSGFILCAVLHSVFSAGIYSVGLVSARNLSPGRPGFGIGVYSGALQLGGMMGMLAGGVMADRAGWSPVFAAGGLACLGGALVLALSPKSGADLPVP
jgi:SET family sugar efflux transporter-like MFS transporter